jgi:predicted dehydrogenase
MEPIRLGVIGLGLIWLRVHKPILESLKEVIEPIAFCDISEQRRAAAVQEFPGAAVLSDYQSLLKLPEVQAVLILTPIPLNAPTAMAALKAGKDVIMEKPIARSVAEGKALIAVARQTGKRLFVAEQFAYRNQEDTMAEIIASGEIGDLVMWERVQHLEVDRAQGPMRYDSTPWRKEANFPLGSLFDGGIHLIAALTKLFGPPETVFASGKQLRPDYGEYDHVAMLFHYANGTAGVLSYSSYLPPVQTHFHVHGTQGSIVVEPNRLLIEKPDQPTRIIDLPQENFYATMWQAMIQAYQENRDPYYTPEKALLDVAILEGVDQSIKTKKNIFIEQEK